MRVHVFFLFLPSTCESAQSMHSIKNFDKLLCYNTIIIIIIFALSPVLSSHSFFFCTPSQTERTCAYGSLDKHQVKAPIELLLFSFSSSLFRCSVFTICLVCGQKKEFAQELNSSRALLRFTTEHSVHTTNSLFHPRSIYLFSQRVNSVCLLFDLCIQD